MFFFYETCSHQAAHFANHNRKMCILSLVANTSRGILISALYKFYYYFFIIISFKTKSDVNG